MIHLCYFIVKTKWLNLMISKIIPFSKSLFQFCDLKKVLKKNSNAVLFEFIFDSITEHYSFISVE